VRFLGAHIAHDDIAAGHAHADLPECASLLLPLRLQLAKSGRHVRIDAPTIAQLDELLLLLDAGSDSALCMVIEGDGSAKKGEDGIALELVDGGAMTLEDLAHLAQVFIDGCTSSVGVRRSEIAEKLVTSEKKALM
jgi:hypothetical protein